MTASHQLPVRARPRPAEQLHPSAGGVSHGTQQRQPPATAAHTPSAQSSVHAPPKRPGGRPANAQRSSPGDICTHAMSIAQSSSLAHAASAAQVSRSGSSGGRAAGGLAASSARNGSMNASR
jgi:hypothetical protein